MTQVALSFYVLTRDSEKYLDRILAQVRRVADELVVVDSGSTDGTREIAGRHGARFVARPFDDFVRQRTFAMGQCEHEWILFLDSDEVPDDELIRALLELKSRGFGAAEGIDAFRIRRYWYALGRKVRAVYPIRCPDAPIRLVRKSKARFTSSSLVHETVDGVERVEILEPGSLAHRTFETPAEIERKLEQYTTLAALDLRAKGKRGSRVKALTHASVAFLKWYFLKGSFRDGAAGWRLGRYAFEYVYRKYAKRAALEERAPS